MTVRVAEPPELLRTVALQAMCDHEGIARDTLEKRLDALAASRRLSPELVDLTKSVRRIGYMRSQTAREIEAADVPAVADLAEALLEYLFRAPAEPAAVRASLAARGVKLYRFPWKPAESGEGQRPAPDDGCRLGCLAWLSSCDNICRSPAGQREPMAREG